MPIDQIISWFQRGSIQGSKSTALAPLLWTIGILSTAVVGCSRADSPGWIVGGLLALLGLLVIGLLGFFGFFAYKNPDALRSEHFTLTKMALQQSMIGDDLAGFIEAIETPNSDAVKSTPVVSLPAPEPIQKDPSTTRKSKDAKKKETEGGGA